MTNHEGLEKNLQKQIDASGSRLSIPPRWRPSNNVDWAPFIEGVPCRRKRGPTTSFYQERAVALTEESGRSLTAASKHHGVRHGK